MHFFGNKSKDDSLNKSGAEVSSEQISDAELLRQFAKGNVSAMDSLINRYRQPLLSWLIGMTGNHADAEDLFQDVWVRILRHAERFTDVSFRAWMWKIARNALIDFRRKKRPSVSLDSVKDEDSVPLVDQLESNGITPSRSIEFDEKTRKIMEAVGNLPAVQREVFLMRTQGELSFAEIAKQLEIPLNTALGRMHDAMKKLKRILREEEEK